MTTLSEHRLQVATARAIQNRILSHLYLTICNSVKVYSSDRVQVVQLHGVDTHNGQNDESLDRNPFVARCPASTVR